MKQQYKNQYTNYLGDIITKKGMEANDMPFNQYMLGNFGALSPLPIGIPIWQ